MATATTQTEPADAATSGLRPFRITADLYSRMVESGVFGDKSSIFLWNGRLVEKVADRTKGRNHGFALNRLARLLPGLLDAGHFVEQAQPMDLGGDSEPEPDLKVVRGAESDYRSRTPNARDVPLVVEVADSSLADDTGEMLRAYAEALIPVYWVVNLPERRIEVYQGPRRRLSDGSPGYTVCQRHGPGDDVPVILDGREVGRLAVRDVLP